MNHFEWSGLLAIMVALVAGWLTDSAAGTPHLAKWRGQVPLLGAVLAGSAISLLWWFF